MIDTKAPRQKTDERCYTANKNLVIGRAIRTYDFGMDLTSFWLSYGFGMPNRAPISAMPDSMARTNQKCRYTVSYTELYIWYGSKG